MSATTQDLESLAVSQVMLPGLVTCHPDDPAARIAASMVIHDVRAVSLQTAGGAGLFVSDLDLVRGALTQPGAAARELASEHAATLTSDTTVADAVAKMSELYADHMLVVDAESGEPSGVLSSFDIAAAIVGGRPRRAAIRIAAPTRSPDSADRLRTTTVATIMQMGVVSCQPNVSIATVARCMVQRHIHCVAVGGVGVEGRREGHFEWGLVDDMDIVQAANRRALGESAGSIAIEAPLAVSEFDPVEHAARLMVDEGARHVVVIGTDGLPSGMVSTRDVASLLAAISIPQGSDD